MSKFVKPEIKVVRFKEADVIVASGQNTFVASNFGNGVAGDGTLRFNGRNYTMSSDAAVSTFLSALNDVGIRNAGISSGNTPMSLRSVMKIEASDDAGIGWNGNYVYDPDATWNNGSKNLKGVFYKQ